jgi:D-alanyl-D-alanine carboxypeptidase/D-alanyl-D-alanine-endopeptidase (penicillin-binding protein 4)
MKTGSLDHVAAIAGYLQARSGRRFAVVMLHNHEDVHRGPGEEAQAALLRWLYEQ